METFIGSSLCSHYTLHFTDLLIYKGKHSQYIINNVLTIHYKEQIKTCKYMYVYEIPL